MRGHRRAGAVGEGGGVGGRGILPLGDAEPDRQVGERVVGTRLVRDDVDLDLAGLLSAEEFGEDLRRVADDADAQRLAGLFRGDDAGESGVEVCRVLVEVAVRDAAGEAGLVDVDDEDGSPVERDGERLRAAHAARAGGEGQGSGEVVAGVFTFSRRERAGDGGKGLVGALEDPLRADVDPRPGRHLAVHREAEVLQAAELRPRRPVADEVRVGDEHARRPFVRAEDSDRLARLDQQRLVGLELVEGADDRVVRVPRPRRAARAAVDDEVFGVLGDLGVEVVHEHPLGRFGAPALGRSLRAPRRPHGPTRGRRGGAVGGLIVCLSHAGLLLSRSRQVSSGLGRYLGA